MAFRKEARLNVNYCIATVMGRGQETEIASFMTRHWHFKNHSVFG